MAVPAATEAQLLLIIFNEMNIDNVPPLARTGLNLLAIAGSLGLCSILLPTRWPGMEILAIGPSWLVMWTICWSMHHSFWAAVAAGMALGLLQDAMTFPAAVALGTIPTHVLSLTIVAVATVWLHKRRYLTTDAILPVAAMTVILTLGAELVLGAQELLQRMLGQSLLLSNESVSYAWQHQLPTIFIAALLSGLWMPILYYPLHLWWQKLTAHAELE